MSVKAILKLVAAAVMAAVAAGGAQYLETDSISLAAVGSAALGAVLAYLKRSPLS